jgi:hypothetical protein
MQKFRARAKRFMFSPKTGRTPKTGRYPLLDVYEAVLVELDQLEEQTRK